MIATRAIHYENVVYLTIASPGGVCQFKRLYSRLSTNTTHFSPSPLVSCLQPATKLSPPLLSYLYSMLPRTNTKRRLAKISEAIHLPTSSTLPTSLMPSWPYLKRKLMPSIKFSGIYVPVRRYIIEQHLRDARVSRPSTLRSRFMLLSRFRWVVASPTAW